MEKVDDEPRALSVLGTGLTRDYQRRPEVEAAISALPTNQDNAYRAAIEQADTLEVIVHGIRQLRRAGDEAGAHQLADTLVGRANRIVARAAGNQFPDSLSDREDAIQDVALQLWQEVLDTSAKEEFWEVNFTHMVIRACSDAADRIRRRKNRDRPFNRSTNDEDGWDEETELPDREPMDTDLLVPEALDQLEGNVRLAMFLHIQGFKARSKNPDEPTISTILNVSDRMVREYLRNGEAQIRQWLAS